jgi:hypothetical protein
MSSDYNKLACEAGCPLFGKRRPVYEEVDYAGKDYWNRKLSAY